MFKASLSQHLISRGCALRTSVRPDKWVNVELQVGAEVHRWTTGLALAAVKKLEDEYEATYGTTLSRTHLSEAGIGYKILSGWFGHKSMDELMADAEAWYLTEQKHQENSRGIAACNPIEGSFADYVQGKNISVVRFTEKEEKKVRAYVAAMEADGVFGEGTFTIKGNDDACVNIMTGLPAPGVVVEQKKLSAKQDKVGGLEGDAAELYRVLYLDSAGKGADYYWFDRAISKTKAGEFSTLFHTGGMNITAYLDQMLVGLEGNKNLSALYKDDGVLAGIPKRQHMIRLIARSRGNFRFDFEDGGNIIFKPIANQ